MSATCYTVSAKFYERISTYIGVKVSIMANYELVRWLNYKDLHLVTNGKCYGIEDMHKKLICPIKYLDIGMFGEFGLAIIKYEKNIFSKVQLGVITEKGEETLFPSDCEDIVILSRNLLAVKVRINKTNSKWMLTTRSGQRLSAPKYDEHPKWIIFDNLLSICIDGLFALSDTKGNQLCKAQYTRFRLEAYYREKETGIACEGARDGFWYKINTKGVEIKTKYHEPVYERVKLVNLPIKYKAKE